SRSRPSSLSGSSSTGGSAATWGTGTVVAATGVTAGVTAAWAGVATGGVLRPVWQALSATPAASSRVVVRSAAIGSARLALAGRGAGLVVDRRRAAVMRQLGALAADATQGGLVKDVDVAGKRRPA